MMNKLFYPSLLIGLLIAPLQLICEGAGLFLYRHTQAGDVEFLFALDPQQHSFFRQGFEYPGGRVDRSDNVDQNNPSSFLGAAIREMLEELVFVPADLLQQAGFFKPIHQPYTAHKEINPAYEKEVIAAVKNAIINTNGIFYIDKQRVNPEHPAGGRNQMIVFFWDITHICPTNLPQQIVAKRDHLRKQNFHLVNDLHAEPDQFAWISGREVIKHLNAKPMNVQPTQYAADTNAPMPSTVTISPACQGMMFNREHDQMNRQENTACIFFKNNFYGYLPNNNQITTIGPVNNELQNSSSMSAIIWFLGNNKNFFRSVHAAAKAAVAQAGPLNPVAQAAPAKAAPAKAVPPMPAAPHETVLKVIDIVHKVVIQAENRYLFAREQAKQQQILLPKQAKKQAPEDDPWSWFESELKKDF